MKYPFWTDPNDYIEVLEATDEAIDKYGHRRGSDFIRLGPEHMEALKAGKVLAWNDSEYSTFVVFEDAVREHRELASIRNEEEDERL